jgi:hypothetical protein
MLFTKTTLKAGACFDKKTTPEFLEFIQKISNKALIKNIEHKTTYVFFSISMKN